MPSLSRYTFVWLPQTMVWSSSGIFACCYIGDIIHLHTFKNPQPPSKSLHNSMGTDNNAISLSVDQELSPLCSGHISGHGHHVCACRLALLVLAGVCLLGHIGLVSGAECGKQECANPRTLDPENKTESRQVPVYLSTTARASIGSRRFLRMAWSQQILSQGRCISWQAWSFQDLLHKLIKTKLDIGGGFSACLEKQTAMAPGEIHTLLLCHHTLRLQIQLVPYKHFNAILFGRVSLDLLQPDIRQVGERLSPCNIIHQDYTLCSSVVGACQRSEAFLARRVPQRQLHPLLSLVHHLQLEIHADRRRRHVGKSVGRKPYQQTALPYPWISYHQDLHQVIELHTSVKGSRLRLRPPRLQYTNKQKTNSSWDRKLAVTKFLTNNLSTSARRSRREWRLLMSSPSRIRFRHRRWCRSRTWSASPPLGLLLRLSRISFTQCFPVVGVRTSS